MAERKLYLQNTPLQQAHEVYLKRCAEIIAPQAEVVAVEDARGRVTLEPVFAAVSSPAYNAAAMDGIAVVATHTAGASETNPVTLYAQEDYVQIDTGDPVLAPYNAVIMAEDVSTVETSAGNSTPHAAETSVVIRAAAAPWQHVRPIGEDFAQGEMIVPSAHTIRPVDVGLMLSGGVFSALVAARPRVAIIPTGTELIDPSTLDSHSAAQALATPGTIIDSNSRMIAALVEEAGGDATREPITADDYDSLKAVIKRAVATHDVVLINAGSSAGREDFTAPLLAELGEVLVHGVAIKPGKPVILAVVEGKPVIGLPGYPLATFHNFSLFVAPVLALFTGATQAQPEEVTAVVSKRIISNLKHREYVQVQVGIVDDKVIASPLSRGAGIISSLARADGYLVIPQELEGLEAGQEANVILNHDLLDIAQTVLSVGSHDLALDIIADLLPQKHPHMHLRSSHVGSLAGLNALVRGEAHIAPTHLLDEETGVYNIQVVRQLFGSRRVEESKRSSKRAEAASCVLIKGLERVQGIMVAPGNPLGIRRVEDLQNVRFINRQRGAGTRVLFDYLLKQLGITGGEIDGYEREGATHMAVASAIAAGSADAGMGVYSAAKTLGLDFISVGNEDYDFAIPERFLELPHIQAFMDVLRSPEFHAQLDVLGGYGYAHAGEIVTP